MNAVAGPYERAAICTLILTDLGDLVRRVQAGNLDQDAFFELTGRMRRQLKELRVDLADHEEITLTDLGAAVGRLLETGQLQLGSTLLDRLPAGARAYRHLAVIDGDQPFETQGN